MTEHSHLPVAAAYIRVSTDDQTELSPDAQIRVIRDDARADGYYIPEEFFFIEKRGVSGRRADNRGEFQRMIATAKSQTPSPFQRLYLWKFSRFARNQEESTFYKGILRKKCGVDIKSVSEPVMEGMFGRLIETIIEWFDEYYSFNLSGEVLRGMTEKALREGYQASPCLGYAAVGDGRPFVIVDSEYAVVEYIHQAYHGGADMTAIAREANARGYRTKRGNLFEKRAVAGILSNRFYAGTVSWNGYTFFGSHECRQSVLSVFKDNQIRMQREYKPKNRREASACGHWASGLLRCGYCGASLACNKSSVSSLAWGGSGGGSPASISGSASRRTGFFQCWRYAKGLHRESCSITIRKVEAAVLQSLDMAASRPDIRYESMTPPSGGCGPQISRLESALSRLSVRETRIRDAYENGIDTLEEYGDKKIQLRKERSEIEAQLRELKTAASHGEEACRPSPRVPVRTTRDLFTSPDIGYEIKGNALRGIVKKIVYDKESGTMKFYYYVSS